MRTEINGESYGFEVRADEPAVEGERAAYSRAINRAHSERAADVAAEGANPLPMTGYKVSLVRGTVLETLNRASGSDPR